jgi:hypothetical protein
VDLLTDGSKQTDVFSSFEAKEPQEYRYERGRTDAAYRAAAHQ